MSKEDRGQLKGERLILSSDTDVQLSIEYFPQELIPFDLLLANNGNMCFDRRYLKCKAGMKVLQLKKFIRLKHGLDAKVHVDFFYKHEFLREEYTIMDLAYIYSWRGVCLLDKIGYFFIVFLLERADFFEFHHFGQRYSRRKT